MKKILIVNLLMILATSGFSQTLSMEQAVAMALKNNHSVKAAESRVTALQKMKGAMLPKTDVSLMYGQYNGYPKNDNNLTITQVIPFTIFGSQGSFNRSKISAGESEKNVIENDVRYNVRRTYTELQYHLTRHDLLSMSDSIYQGFLKSAKLRYESGEAKLLEKLTAESQRMDIQNHLKQNALDIERLESELQLLLNLLTKPQPEKNLTALDFQLLDTTQVSKTPAIVFREQRVNVANAEKKLRSGSVAPDLLVGFFSQTLIGSVNPKTGELATSNERFTGFQIGLAIPLWIGPQLGRVRAAEYEKQAAIEDLEYEKQTVNNQYQQSLRQLSIYQERLKYYTEVALPNAEVLLHQSTLSYREGEIGYPEFLQGLHSSLNVRETYLKTINDYNQTINYLHYLSGN
jgi:heavy metal efflux system protein